MGLDGRPGGVRALQALLGPPHTLTLFRPPRAALRGHQIDPPKDSPGKTPQAGPVGRRGLDVKGESVPVDLGEYWVGTIPSTTPPPVPTCLHHPGYHPSRDHRTGVPECTNTRFRSSQGDPRVNNARVSLGPARSPDAGPAVSPGARLLGPAVSWTGLA